MSHWQRTFDRLDRISRARALTLVESLSLERAIDEIERAAPPPLPLRATRWTADMDDALASRIGDGMSIRAASVAIGKTASAGVSRWAKIRHLYPTSIDGGAA